EVPENVNPGAVQKSLEGRKSVSPGLQSEIPLELPRRGKGVKKIQKGVKILVKRFEFKGNKVLSDKYLDRVVAGYTGKELSFSDLEEVCRKIETAYREKGYFLAQAIIPPQEVKGGVVVIKILEGRLGKVEVEGERHYKERFIKGHFKPTEKGVINYHRLLKTLLLLNEYPDLKVHATLKRGEVPGTTDILLKVEDRWPVHFYLDYNDFGTRYVSRHRFGSTLECSNVLLQGDTFKFRGVVGSPIKQLQFVKFEYTFPLGTSDTKLGLHYTYLTYKVGREFRVLDLRGKSKIFTVDLVHPVVRTRRSSLDVGVAFDYKQIRDYLLGQVTSDDELRIVRALARYSHLDGLRGRNQIYLEWS
ncbi:MAG: ShlB/FhaC/HecB family hemolysin secretion/activation protein, partial [Crenarchaeota archaeon]|nr:ShlB/FhaC/HecB family hemolysin secretion/activation protein [Thermoproteota archaeon]